MAMVVHLDGSAQISPERGFACEILHSGTHGRGGIRFEKTDHFPLDKSNIMRYIAYTIVDMQIVFWEKLYLQ